MADEDPIIVVNFVLEVDGIKTAWKKCSGLKVEMEVAQAFSNTPEGKSVLQNVPAKVKYSDITMERWLTSDMKLYEWFTKSLSTQNSSGSIVGFLGGARKTGSISLRNMQNEEKARYELTDVFIKSHAVSDPDAAGTNPTTETIVLSVTECKRVK